MDESRADSPLPTALARREFLGTIAASGAALALPRPHRPPRADDRAFGADRDFDLDETTVEELQERMRSGATSALEVTKRFLERIAEVDSRGPTLKAVIELNPDALSSAQTLDTERRTRGPRSPLHGIPVLIKDNIATSGRMRTSAGSLALAESVAPREAPVVQSLRRAGAVILGKTNLSEWANFRASRSTSGWSARGGQTRNPYVLDRNPCGSSSGSAVAVSANLSVLALGTETDGSIVCPASTCGIVGIKPTRGVVSTAEVIPISRTQDTVGPMARTVADAAALLGALSGVDFTKALDPAGLRGARLGVARAHFGFHDMVDREMEGVIQALRDEGAILIDPADPELPSELGDWEFEVLLYEFKAGVNEYLAGLGAGTPIRSLADLIEFNERHRDKEMRLFGQDLLIKAEAKGPLTDRAYREALGASGRAAGRDGIDAVLAKHRIEAIVAPTRAPAWVTDWINGDPSGGGHIAGLPAIAGYPHVTVPAGSVHGLPFGLSFIGPAHSEASLLRFAHAFEHATRARRKPAFLPTAAI